MPKYTKTCTYKFTHGLFEACFNLEGCSTVIFIITLPTFALEEIVRDICNVRRPFSYLCFPIIGIPSFCCWGPIFGCIRKKFRKIRKIKGFLLKDIIITCLCPFCVITQILLQIRDDVLNIEDKSVQSNDSDNSN